MGTRFDQSGKRDRYLVHLTETLRPTAPALGGAIELGVASPRPKILLGLGEGDGENRPIIRVVQIKQFACRQLVMKRSFVGGRWIAGPS
jgi:hypothetical protein